MAARLGVKYHFSRIACMTKRRRCGVATRKVDTFFLGLTRREVKSPWEPTSESASIDIARGSSANFLATMTTLFSSSSLVIVPHANFKAGARRGTPLVVVFYETFNIKPVDNAERISQTEYNACYEDQPECLWFFQRIMSTQVGLHQNHSILSGLFPQHYPWT
jgi:hypothetical protein